MTAPLAKDDRGITIILVALLMVALLVTVATVIDLSIVRSSRQSNKSSTDFAVTAGLRGMETPEGVPLPWGGVCAALEYLKVNNSDLASLSGTYSNLAGDEYDPSPCNDEAAVPYTTPCVGADPSTWARFEGTAGRFSVEIQSGYILGADSRFPEDDGAYSGDTGDSTLGGCDHLSVIVNETDGAIFGGIAGRSDYATTTRSVGRVEIGSAATETVALLLLEDQDCEVIVTEGNNTYIRVRATPLIGTPTRPGLIHTNSDGSQNCSGSARVVEGSNACPAVTACAGSGPSIVAESAGATPGKIGVRAVGTNDGTVSTTSCASATAPTAGCTVAPIPINRGIVTRAPVDARYLTHARALKTLAETASAGYVTAPNCNLPAAGVTSATYGGAKVIFDCDLTIANNATRVFDSTVTDVIVTGDLSVRGTLQAQNLRTLFVRGDNGVSVTGILRVNDGGLATCSLRATAAPSLVAKLVVTNGPFTSTGSVFLCNTFVFLSDGALPASEGTAPSDNTYEGRIDLGAQSSVDWKAPNQTTAAVNVGDAVLADFEDMALWSEYSGNGTPGNAARIGGQGNLVTTGVYFLPNANPFSLAGGGTGATIEVDAQFIVRKIRLSGTVALTMAPDPNNSIPTPVFEGFGLVR